MDWLQISVELPTANGDIEPLENLLLSLGASAVSLANATDHPLFEPAPDETPLWQHSWVTGLFSANTEPANVLFGVQAHLGLAQLPPYRVESLEDRDWIRAGLKDIKPMRFGQRLWVCPSNHHVSAPDAVVVNLDPGLAFGTGTHPSTALCLRALDGCVRIPNSVIDYGCGSGILGVAAALLGAGVVHAVDIDPQALLATQDNAQRNHVSDRIKASLPDALGPAPVDLLVANILSGTLKALAPDFAKRVTPGGGIILSGLLETDALSIRDAYAPWFELPDATIENGWLCLVGTRTGVTTPA